MEPAAKRRRVDGASPRECTDPCFPYLERCWTHFQSWVIDRAATDSAAEFITLSDLQRSCVTRDFLLENKDVGFLNKLVRGLFARAVPPEARSARLFAIAGLGRPSSRKHPAGHSLRGEIPCALTLNLFDIEKVWAVPVAMDLLLFFRAAHEKRLVCFRWQGTTIRLPFASVSNSRPHREDLLTAIRSRYAEKANAFKADWERMCRPIRRIVKDRREGRHCTVNGRPWGSKHTKHEVWVLLRSWRVLPTSDEALGGADLGASAPMATVMDGDPADPEYFRISLAPPTKPGDYFGWGPSRHREKWRGPFSTLVQHHQRVQGGEAALRPPRLRAILEDEEQPDITAWRVLRRYAHEDIPLSALRTCTLARVDLVPRRNDEAPGRLWDPRSNARAAGAATAAAAAASGGGRPDDGPVFQLPEVAPSPRVLESPVQLYIVDADALLRAGWPPRDDSAGAANSLPLGQCPVLRRNRRNPDDIWGPTAAVRTDTFPEGLAWLEEAWWDRILPAAEVPHTTPWGARFEPTPALAPAPRASGPGADEPAAAAPATKTGGPSGTLSIHGVPLAPSMTRAFSSMDQSTSASLRSLLCPPRRGNWLRLYHGTKPSLARTVQAKGFLRPACRNLAVCRGEVPGRGCECQMEGFGVYFGDRVKAHKFAVRRAERIPEEDVTAGAIIVADVDVGRCKPAPRKPCPCGCGQSYVDHLGSWYSMEGFDSLYVSDHSMPASATAECCVADPDRIRVVAVESIPVEATAALPAPANDLSEGPGPGPA